ncbi:MAG: nucleotidyltransferase family protein [Candidatus Bipolaricaulota bacterium]
MIQIIERLSASGIQVWVCGGWGIDVLLGRETRPHKDLDILVRLDDIVRARTLLEADGYRLTEIWSENRRAGDVHGVETDTAFVLEDAAGRQIDLHAISLMPDGGAFPAYDGEGMTFSADDLSGKGTIAGFPVQCLSVRMQFRGHTGYKLPERQVADLELLRERFGPERAT